MLIIQCTPDFVNIIHQYAHGIPIYVETIIPGLMKIFFLSHFQNPTLLQNFFLKMK